MGMQRCWQDARVVVLEEALVVAIRATDSVQAALTEAASSR